MSRAFALSARVEIFFKVCTSRVAKGLRYLAFLKAKNDLTPTYDLQRSQNKVPLLRLAIF